MREEILESIIRLDRWIEKNGWAGYDPYDVWAHPLVDGLRLTRNYMLKWFNTEVGKNTEGKASSERQDRIASVLRKALMMRKQYNAKGMGLFASAYVNLHRLTGEQPYLQKATYCLDWLEQNRNRNYPGYCWGYPFSWRTAIYYPKGTPSAVISSACGNAFWDFYNLSGEKKYLESCEKVGTFLSQGLNIHPVADDRICFSYTPLDKFHIHNANLFAAEFLIRIGKELNRDDFSRLGIHATNYTLAAQNDDGSFYYWGAEDKGLYVPDAVLMLIDHYHTGFVLRALHSICQMTQDQGTQVVLTKGYNFYRDNLFQNKTVPRLFPHSTYPVDIHSCSEAILCMSTLSRLFPDALEFAQNAFRWTKENMQDKDGYFYYRLRDSGVIKTPYMRWGQAWMLAALAALYQASTARAKS